jgi:hypothetical protein
MRRLARCLVLVLTSFVTSAPLRTARHWGGGLNRSLLRRSAAWQREGASRHPFFSHLLRFLWIFLALPLIGAAHILMREGHPHELVVLEDEACRAGPVLVLFLLEFAEDALRFLFLGFFLFGFRLFGRHRAGARIVIGKSLFFSAALETRMRLAGAGDDLSLSHAKIGRSGVASRGNAARTKTDDACGEGKPDRTPSKGAHEIPVAPKSDVIMAVQLSGARFQASAH